MYSHLSVMRCCKSGRMWRTCFCDTTDPTLHTVHSHTTDNTNASVEFRIMDQTISFLNVSALVCESLLNWTRLLLLHKSMFQMFIFLIKHIGRSLFDGSVFFIKSHTRCCEPLLPQVPWDGLMVMWQPYHINQTWYPQVTHTLVGQLLGLFIIFGCHFSLHNAVPYGLSLIIWLQYIILQ